MLNIHQDSGYFSKTWKIKHVKITIFYGVYEPLIAICRLSGFMDLQMLSRFTNSKSRTIWSTLLFECYQLIVSWSTFTTWFTLCQKGEKVARILSLLFVAIMHTKHSQTHASQHAIVLLKTTSYRLNDGQHSVGNQTYWTTMFYTVDTINPPETLWTIPIMECML